MNEDEKVLDLIRQAKAKFLQPSDQGVIGQWESNAKKALLINSLKDNVGIRYILDSFDTDIADMNSLLLGASSKELSDIERDRLIDKRDMYSKFVNIFVDAGKAIRNVKKQLEENNLE